MQPGLEIISWAPFTAGARQQQVASLPQYISTFRKGPKWNRHDLVGKRLSLFDEATQKVFATATVISVKHVLFKDIDATDYSRQSAPVSPEQMLVTMKQAYNGEYDENTPTTVVTLGNIELVGVAG